MTPALPPRHSRGAVEDRRGARAPLLAVVVALAACGGNGGDEATMIPVGTVDPGTSKTSPLSPRSRLTIDEQGWRALFAPEDDELAFEHEDGRFPGLHARAARRRSEDGRRPVSTDLGECAAQASGAATNAGCTRLRRRRERDTCRRVPDPSDTDIFWYPPGAMHTNPRSPLARLRRRRRGTPLRSCTQRRPRQFDQAPQPQFEPLLASSSSTRRRRTAPTRSSARKTVEMPAQYRSAGWPSHPASSLRAVSRACDPRRVERCSPTTGSSGRRCGWALPRIRRSGRVSLTRSGTGSPTRGRRPLLRDRADVTPWQFLCGLLDTLRIAFHGTGDRASESFEPRKSIDFARLVTRSRLRHERPIWAMFYAIVDRDRHEWTSTTVASLLLDSEGRPGVLHYLLDHPRRAGERRGEPPRLLPARGELRRAALGHVRRSRRSRTAAGEPRPGFSLSAASFLQFRPLEGI